MAGMAHRPSIVTVSFTSFPVIPAWPVLPRADSRTMPAFMSTRPSEEAAHRTWVTPTSQWRAEQMTRDQWEKLVTDELAKLAPDKEAHAGGQPSVSVVLSEGR